MPQQVSTFHSFSICKMRHRSFFIPVFLVLIFPKLILYFIIPSYIPILSKSNKSLEVQPYTCFIRVQLPLPRPYPRPMQVLGFKDKQALGLTFCPHSRLYHNMNKRSYIWFDLIWVFIMTYHLYILRVSLKNTVCNSNFRVCVCNYSVDGNLFPILWIWQPCWRLMLVINAALNWLIGWLVCVNTQQKREGIAQESINFDAN